MKSGFTFQRDRIDLQVKLIAFNIFVSKASEHGRYFLYIVHNFESNWNGFRTIFVL